MCGGKSPLDDVVELIEETVGNPAEDVAKSTSRLAKEPAERKAREEKETKRLRKEETKRRQTLRAKQKSKQEPTGRKATILSDAISKDDEIEQSSLVTGASNGKSLLGI